MNKKFKNVFVDFELAKLAYQKGFKEWCPSMVSKKRGYTPTFYEKLIEGSLHTLFDLSEIKDYPVNQHYYCPTHSQLIFWLKDNHNINLEIKMVNKTYELNDLLTLALNTLSDVIVNENNKN